jgi:hypothetical protein
VKSWRQYEKGLSTCYLAVRDYVIEIGEHKPAKDGRGFTGDGEIKLPRSTPWIQVASLILDSLRNPRHIKSV